MNNDQGLPLLKPATAYQSFRESGFDFPTAIGELIDNSVQANAQRIDIIPGIEQKETEGGAEVISVITQIAVVDDGDGMDEKTLNGCLQLGFSTRYNDRKGLGRFGVGATAASISQCRHTIYCSRPKGTGDFLATYIDLDKIADNTQTVIPKPSRTYFPKDLKNINYDNSSTIVVWSQCDRLQHDANGRPTQADGLLTELKNWVSRAYRYIIWKGVEIFINSEKVLAHDPLYLNSSQTGFLDDPLAREKFSVSVEWPVPNSPGKTSSISVKLTLLPEKWRRKQGDGGRPHAQERRIDENQDISILRHNREVAFGNFYPMVPKQEDIDRWWGCEISFESALDECWEIKNIKRGARPTTALRNKLRDLLFPKIRDLRKEVQQYWKTRIPSDVVEYVNQTASSLLNEINGVTAPEVVNRLKGTKISTDDVSRIMEQLAIENKWDWTTDGTHRKYTRSKPPLSDPERKMYFEDIRDAIENSNINQEFKDVALYDLEQARVSYESRAFKACIVMFGAVIEGLMLGIIRNDNTSLTNMIKDPLGAPNVLKKRGLGQFSKPEELANEISERLTFEDYKNIILHLKPEIEKLQIERIQNFRNTIHPWKSIKEPNIFSDPSQARAMHYLTALSLLAEKILD